MTRHHHRYHGYIIDPHSGIAILVQKTLSVQSTFATRYIYIRFPWLRFDDYYAADYNYDNNTYHSNDTVVLPPLVAAGSVL